jgi:hypothetical protein
MTISHSEPGSWLLGNYHIDGHRRELRAIRVPGEQTLHIIDVLARPRDEEGELDQRNVEDRVSSLDEAEAIATDYINLAEQIGWPPMPDIWW